MWWFSWAKQPVTGQRQDVGEIVMMRKKYWEKKLLLMWNHWIQGIGLTNIAKCKPLISKIKKYSKMNSFSWPFKCFYVALPVSVKLICFYAKLTNSQNAGSMLKRWGLHITQHNYNFQQLADSAYEVWTEFKVSPTHISNTSVYSLIKANCSPRVTSDLTFSSRAEI